jgi:hypothetical protein
MRDPVLAVIAPDFTARLSRWSSRSFCSATPLKTRVPAREYRPAFPDRFDSIEHARSFCRAFFTGTTISTATPGSMMTPTAVHHRHAQALFTERQRVLAGAYT